MAEAGRAAQEAARAAKGYAYDEVLGARQWKRSKLGWLTGAGAVRDSMGTIRGQAGDSRERLRTLWRHAFVGESQGVAIDPDIEATDERFREAMRVNGRSLSDVNKSVDNTYRQFWLFAGLTGFSVLVAAWLLLSMMLAGHLNPIGAVFAFLPIPLVGPLALRAGYTNWMFRRRRLDGIGEYLRSGRILPTKAPPMPRSVAPVRKAPSTTVRSLALGFVMLAGLGAAGTPSPARAAGTDATTQQTDPASVAQQVVAAPGDKDLFVKMLGVIVPNVGPIPAGDYGSNNPIADATKQALGIFAGVLLFLGITVNGYQILTGLVASAKEGKALGERYHEVWAPLRVVVGYGFLVPAIGGLCAAQVLVLYFIIWGGNMANIVWNGYTDRMISQYQGGATDGTNDPSKRGTEQQGVAAQVAVEQGAAIVKRVAQKSLCLAVSRAELKSRGGDAAQSVGSGAPAWNDVPGIWFIRDEKYQASFVDALSSGATGTGDIYTNAVIDCGTVTSYIHPVKSGETTSNVQNDLDKTSADAIGKVISAVYPEMDKYAQTYAHTGGSSPPAFGPSGTASTTILTQAVKDYADTMSARARSIWQQSDITQGASGQLNDMKQTIHDAGWASSGTFYLTLSRLSAAMYSSLDQQSGGANQTDDQQSIKDPFLSEAVFGSRSRTGAMPAFDAWYKSHMSTVKLSDNNDYASKDRMTDAASSFASSTPTIGLLSPIIMGVLKFADNQLDTNPFMAMQRLTDMGNWFIWMGSGVWVLTAGISGVGTGLTHNGASSAGLLGSLAGTLTGGANFLAYALGGAITGIATLGSYVAIGLIGAGILHAYVLPMIPYIMVTFFVMGMLVLVVESLVAAPLWAFFHIRMEGHEFVDAVQKPGYMIAFNLLLRPTLMIFGLILSNGIFGAMIFFTSHTFYPTISALNSSNNLGPIGMVTLIVMMAYVHFQLAIRSFTLITQLPDRVTRWFGQGGENLGEEDHSTRTTGFVAGEIKSGTSNALGAPKGRRDFGPKPGGGADKGNPAAKLGSAPADTTKGNNGNGGGLSAAEVQAPVESASQQGPQPKTGSTPSRD